LRSSSLAGGVVLPVWALREYYWCPVSAFLALSGWAPRATPSMAVGASSVPRGRLAELVGERHVVEELLWEHPVESRRLGLRGRADLVALTAAGGPVVVEAKLSPVPRAAARGRGLGAAVQLAAYVVAVEETLGAPVEASYIYSVEADRLVEVRVGPGLRRLVEHAAGELREAVALGRPPAAVGAARGRRCRACGYRRGCPVARG